MSHKLLLAREVESIYTMLLNRVFCLQWLAKVSILLESAPDTQWLLVRLLLATEHNYDAIIMMRVLHCYVIDHMILSMHY